MNKIKIFLLYSALVSIFCFLIFTQFNNKKNFEKAVNCVTEKNIKEKKLHSKEFEFLVIGHAYGNKDNPKNFLYNKLKNALDKESNISFIVFTGDVFFEANQENFRNFKNYLKDKNFIFYIAPGNHDIPSYESRELYNSNFGNSFNFFLRGKNVFLVLDTELLEDSEENKQQIEFVQSRLVNLGENFSNIFIFMHKNIFFNQTNKKDEDFKNFLIENLNKTKNIYIFSGDTGLHDNGKELMCKKSLNKLMVSSGMGSGKNDNFLRIKVFKDNKVNLEVVKF